MVDHLGAQYLQGCHQNLELLRVSSSPSPKVSPAVLGFAIQGVPHRACFCFVGVDGFSALLWCPWLSFMDLVEVLLLLVILCFRVGKINKEFTTV